MKRTSRFLVSQRMLGPLLMTITTVFLFRLYRSDDDGRETLSVLSGYLSALGSLLVAFLTIRLLGETEALRRVETDPDVVVYLEQEERWSGFVEMVIKNIGRGSAVSISFPELPAFRIFFDEAEPESPGFWLSEMDIFRGIAILAPGQEYRFYYTSLGHALDGKVLPITLKVRYRGQEDEREVRAFDRTFVIDALVFRHMTRHGPPPLDSIAQSMKRVDTNIKYIRGDIHAEVARRREDNRAGNSGLIYRLREQRNRRSEEGIQRQADAILRGEKPWESLFDDQRYTPYRQFRFLLRSFWRLLRRQ